MEKESSIQEQIQFHQTLGNFDPKKSDCVIVILGRNEEPIGFVKNIVYNGHTVNYDIVKDIRRAERYKNHKAHYVRNVLAHDSFCFFIATPVGSDQERDELLGSYNIPPKFMVKISTKEFIRLFFSYHYKAEFRELRMVGGVFRSHVHHMNGNDGLGLIQLGRNEQLVHYRFGQPKRWKEMETDYNKQFAGDRS